eukprot:TRINITY_DN247895_c0_g1_i1.p1 TRINITY_DN247895_c0_g1~~TRINITY_DN247895_c0_g1_i1.p1  ORF type:complete len:204 (-),score=27.26 TRINITY_DN247895_c0_g1_i1:226-837(-)
MGLYTRGLDVRKPRHFPNKVVMDVPPNTYKLIECPAVLENAVSSVEWEIFAKRMQEYCSWHFRHTKWYFGLVITFLCVLLSPALCGINEIFGIFVTLCFLLVSIVGAIYVFVVSIRATRMNRILVQELMQEMNTKFPFLDFSAVRSGYIISIVYQVDGIETDPGMPQASVNSPILSAMNPSPYQPPQLKNEEEQTPILFKEVR